MENDRDTSLKVGNVSSVPAQIGTPAAAEHKTAPDAKVAGADFSLQEFINCVRTGGAASACRARAPNASRLHN